MINTWIISTFILMAYVIMNEIRIKMLKNHYKKRLEFLEKYHRNIIYTVRNPSTTDTDCYYLQIWINQLTNDIFIMVDKHEVKWEKLTAQYLYKHNAI